MLRFTGRSPQFAVEGYSPENTTWDFVRLLVIGSGGIGCELLHLLALSGFSDLTVIDMDTIELSNLNRQFLFREKDVGKPKSEVAAAFVNARCPGVHVEAVFGKIEDQPDDFYRSFDAILLALDSISARLWINRKVAELATWEVDTESAGPPTSRITQAIPLIDTGTEGFLGHCRVINMTNNATPCIECEMYLFSVASKQVPMCTLENIPRTPAHCVLYVQFKQWVDANPGVDLDGDNPEHIRWVTQKARERQVQFGIAGPPINEFFTLGVVKNVVPAVGFTNALVAGQAVTEVLKWIIGAAPSLDNYHLYNGSAGQAGIHSNVDKLCGVPNGAGSVCSVCGPRPVLSLLTSDSPQAIRAALAEASAPDTRDDVLSGTVLLSFAGVSPSSSSPSATATAPTTTGEASLTRQEVFLTFRANNPMARPVRGSTLKEVLTEAGHGNFLRDWCARKVLALVECSSASPPITALAMCTEV